MTKELLHDCDIIEFTLEVRLTLKNIYWQFIIGNDAVMRGTSIGSFVVEISKAFHLYETWTLPQLLSGLSLDL